MLVKKLSAVWVRPDWTVALLQKSATVSTCFNQILQRRFPEIMGLGVFPSIYGIDLSGVQAHVFSQSTTSNPDVHL